EPRLFLNLLLPLLLLAGSVFAADQPTADELIDNVEETLATHDDLSFLVTGNLQMDDGTQYPLEIEVEALPRLELIRLEILQPDAMADNFIIATSEEIYNYNFMTNQVVVHNSN